MVKAIKKSLWVRLAIQPVPYLHTLAPVDRNSFVLLDAYLRDCIEEWFASGGQLSARSIVLLDNCARSITKHFKLLDGEGQYYFGQFRRLARLILHDLDVDQAYHQAEKELETTFAAELFFNEGFSNHAQSLIISTHDG